jgi:hypothetical protein
MSIGLEYMDRLFGHQERLKTERKRIMAQTRRILSQREMEWERAAGSIMRGMAVTGMDELERKKLSKQSRWKLKWDKRKARWDARSRKFKSR